MKKAVLYCAWAVLYILCAILGHIESPQGAQSVAMTILSVVFFVPGFWLLVQALRDNSHKDLVCLRLISGISLGLTLIALIANIASVAGSELLGQVFYVILIWVSSPMICSRYWVLSLFLWACILCGTFYKRLSKKSKR